MLLNYETVIVGEVCILVPYRPEHVEQYHQWMQNPDLLEATASEPLSLEEEYDMQKSWQIDSNKCTFIVLARSLLSHECEQVVVAALKVATGEPKGTQRNEYNSFDFVQKSLSAMVGDVNIFISDEEDPDVEEADNDAAVRDGFTATPSTKRGHNPKQAEIDIMIAEKEYQRKGLGREAVILMLMYGALHLDIRRYFCKINEDNKASLNLFQSTLGFRQCGYSACFQEVELELKADSATKLLNLLKSLSLTSNERLSTFVIR